MEMRDYLRLVAEEHRQEEERRKNRWYAVGAILTCLAFSFMVAVAIVGWPF